MRTHSLATALVRSGALAAVIATAAACGGTTVTTPEDESGSGGQDSAAAPTTELTIEITYADDPPAEGGTEPKDWTLTCGPAGGDHPDPEAACADLDEAGAEGFEEVPEDQACTYEMGGPEIAEVEGHVGGTDVSTEFNKSGGCEIARYEEMGAVLTP
ncbi:SSI family serine proteinase inhibitor [Nocardiopsis chromatogenes]|uniref:SSI family serine proteinase inhibitor n=1 Tax=Nocardiopsis chromatogenes TaxID=280239 RepID=UPI00037666FB|nr:SSI family serine proteinase inhibitor [Nocardiopsis chromatogenes]